VEIVIRWLWVDLCRITARPAASLAMAVIMVRRQEAVGAAKAPPYNLTLDEILTDLLLWPDRPRPVLTGRAWVTEELRRKY
jgi:hypothetical protein